jgi:hypothetical protein
MIYKLVVPKEVVEGIEDIILVQYALLYCLGQGSFLPILLPLLKSIISAPSNLKGSAGSGLSFGFSNCSNISRSL